MSRAPYLSVIVPVYQGRVVLPLCLASLAASDLPRAEWELIVVDDGSTDGTGEIARPLADAVVRLDRGPSGPGVARNRGSEAARGEVLVFIDADTRVHPDTLARFAAAFREGPDVTAIFGAYDDTPADPGFLSQYRNLLHRYVHMRDAGPAETFWAGCGAVRSAAFRALGGFDEVRFPRPQIEDIELGYRVVDQGGRIVLDPRIQVQHLKRWGLVGMVRTDLLDRGVPWMKLILERGGLASSSSLNLRSGERTKTALTGLVGVFAALALATREPRWLLGSAAAGAGVILMSLPLLRWFADVRGRLFAARVVPFVFLYYLISGLAVILGWSSHVRAGRPRA